MRIGGRDRATVTSVDPHTIGPTLEAAGAESNFLPEHTHPLATGVPLIPQHDPIVLAEQIATLDLLSAGRSMPGGGAGRSRSPSSSPHPTARPHDRAVGERLAVAGIERCVFNFPWHDLATTERSLAALVALTDSDRSP